MNYFSLKTPHLTSIKYDTEGHVIHLSTNALGFPGGSEVKNPSAKAGDTDLLPGLGRSPGEGNGNPFQYSCLGNRMERRARWP